MDGNYYLNILFQYHGSIYSLCVLIYSVVLGGSLEIYGAIPEPVLGRISVAVSSNKLFCIHTVVNPLSCHAPDAS